MTTKSRKAERVVERETLVSTGGDVAEKMVRVFQKSTMQTFLSLMQGEMAEQ